jgi:hypothetical protein
LGHDLFLAKPEAEVQRQNNLLTRKICGLNLRHGRG